MKVADVMTAGLAQIAHDQTIEQAAQQMAAANVGSLPVVRGGALVGVVTDRDLVIRALAKGHGAQTPVASVMTSEVVSIGADEPIAHAAKLMADKQIRRIYVTEQGAPCGVVALGDVAKVESTIDSGDALRKISRD